MREREATSAEEEKKNSSTLSSVQEASFGVLNSRTRILHSLIYCPTKKGDRKRETDKGREAALNRLLKELQCDYRPPFLLLRRRPARAAPCAAARLARRSPDTRWWVTLDRDDRLALEGGGESGARADRSEGSRQFQSRAKLLIGHLLSFDLSTNNKTSSRPRRALCW